MSPSSQSTKRRMVAKPSRNFHSYNSSVEPASIMSQPNFGAGSPVRPTGKKLSESRTVVNRQASILDENRIVLYKKGKRMGKGYYIVEISSCHTKMYITAFNVEKPQSMILEIPEKRARYILEQFNNDLSYLASCLTVQSGSKLILLNPYYSTSQPKSVSPRFNNINFSSSDAVMAGPTSELDQTMSNYQGGNELDYTMYHQTAVVDPDSQGFGTVEDATDMMSQEQRNVRSSQEMAAEADILNDQARQAFHSHKEGPVPDEEQEDEQATSVANDDFEHRRYRRGMKAQSLGQIQAGRRGIRAKPRTTGQMGRGGNQVFANSRNEHENNNTFRSHVVVTSPNTRGTEEPEDQREQHGQTFDNVKSNLKSNELSKQRKRQMNSPPSSNVAMIGKPKTTKAATQKTMGGSNNFFRPTQQAGSNNRRVQPTYRLRKPQPTTGPTTGLKSGPHSGAHQPNLSSTSKAQSNNQSQSNNNNSKSLKSQKQLPPSQSKNEENEWAEEKQKGQSTDRLDIFASVGQPDEDQQRKSSSFGPAAIQNDVKAQDEQQAQFSKALYKQNQEEDAPDNGSSKPGATVSEEQAATPKEVNQEITDQQATFRLASPETGYEEEKPEAEQKKPESEEDKPEVQVQEGLVVEATGTEHELQEVERVSAVEAQAAVSDAYSEDQFAIESPQADLAANGKKAIVSASNPPNEQQDDDVPIAVEDDYSEENFMTEPTPKNATTKLDNEAYEEVKEDLIDEEKKSSTDNGNGNNKTKAIQ